MPNTINRAYPYPLPTADPDVPYWNQQLAEALDVDMKARVDALAKLPTKVAKGQDSIFIGAAVANASLTVNLPAGFTVAPIVTASIVTATAGRASLLQLSITSQTTTTFVARLYTSDNANTGTSYTITFNWIAVQ
jgi:hypothetical protein